MVERPRPVQDNRQKGQKKLAHLNALRAFEAVVRHMSFAKAAEELAVTPGAISQQIKLLEDYYDIRLFRREGRLRPPRACDRRASGQQGWGIRAGNLPADLRGEMVGPAPRRVRDRASG